VPTEAVKRLFFAVEGKKLGKAQGLLNQPFDEAPLPDAYWVDKEGLPRMLTTAVSVVFDNRTESHVPEGRSPAWPYGGETTEPA
jgi:hypothetical protein